MSDHFVKSMARSILGVKPPQADVSAGVRIDGPPLGTRGRLGGIELQARLRQKRSSAYVEAMTRLDAGGHVHSAATTQALIDAIRAELPDVQIDALPLGIISKCYLGVPYEVHTLNCTGNIIQHYKSGEPLTQGMERARSLARSGHYAFIEVYTDKLIAVSLSGQTAIIES
jgi:hypothetical protein